MLKVSTPPGYEPERRYILEVVLSDFLGQPFTMEKTDRADVSITVEERKRLTIADALFATPSEQWLTPAPLPAKPLRWWDVARSPAREALGEARVPVLYGHPLANGAFVNATEDAVSLGLDVFGSAFFMLARYEEVARPARGRHGRFPASASLAGREGFLERPIVNEYVEVLWWALRRLWPRLKRPQRQYEVHLSHDVDEPLSVAFRPARGVLRHAASDLVRRGDVRTAARRLRALVQTRRGHLDGDPANTFDYIMTQSERRGLTSAFYVIADRTTEEDGAYSIHHPWIRKLLRRIHAREHEIGLHGSYAAYDNPAQLGREFGILRRVAEEEGIAQGAWGGRQHYLRWATPRTPAAWACAGLDYDSTLGFADRIGFRAGVCYPYPFFDAVRRERLGLVERPLLAMERTLVDVRYMGAAWEAVAEQLQALKRRVARVQGAFTLLWHNSLLVTPRQKAAYEETLDVLLSS